MQMSFKSWFNEMAMVNFGKHQGQDHTRLPTPYLQWLKDKMRTGARFDIGGLNGREAQAAIDQELTKRVSSPVPVKSLPSNPFAAKYSPEPVKPAPPKDPSKAWVWAKSIRVAPEYQLPAIGLDLAMRQKDANDWTFVILDTEENRLVSYGTIPAIDLKNTVKSEVGPDGQRVFGEKPSRLLKIIAPKKEKKSGNTIPDERITPEQKQIEEKFAQMLANPVQNHMVISARAGTGKTTVLKHLAWKFGKGKKWLYLVFNSANRQEAKEEFPPSVQVETTNSWAGRELLGKNLMQPTDRMIDFSKSEKSKMIADSKAFTQLMTSMSIPDPVETYGTDNPKELSSTERSLWYTLRSISYEFKTEAVKLLGLAKSFSVDPRNESELEKNITNVINKYDLNTNLEEIKERLLKNSPWQVSYIDQVMGKPFIGRNFTPELTTATMWLLKQLMPHASKETFMPDKGSQAGTQQPLGNKRDFDDDLWFSAVHANELKWPHYDVVLADEVQDFNEAQKIILSKLAEAGAKIVAVGDKFQSIYRFRGADSNAFEGLSKMLQEKSADKDVERGLTKNFRSRKAVIDFSNEEGADAGHVSDLQMGRNFKTGPGKIGEGKATKEEVTYDDAFNDLKKEWDHMGEVKNTAFLSRTNEPLVHASLKLMKEGIPFLILGKDIANDLNKHIDKIIGLFRLQNNSSVMELKEAITSHNAEQGERHSGKAAMAGKLKELKEVTEAMGSALEQFEEDNPDGTILNFRQWLHAKFGGLDIEKSGPEGDKARKEFKQKMEELNPVVLSTVHKSKGLQFHRVYVLRDDMWPHPRATMQADLDQEMNNKYIGRTRAEDEIHVLKKKGQPGYKDPDEDSRSLAS